MTILWPHVTFQQPTSCRQAESFYQPPDAISITSSQIACRSWTRESRFRSDLKRISTYICLNSPLDISIEIGSLVTIRTNVIHLAQNRIQWRSLVSTEFHERRRISWPRKRVTAALWSENALRVCSDDCVRHRTDIRMCSLLFYSFSLSVIFDLWRHLTRTFNFDMREEYEMTKCLK
jgi:hypothetical protein